MAKLNNITKRDAKAEVAEIIQNLKGKVSRGANVQTRDFYKGVARDLEIIAKLHDQRTK